MSPPSPWYAWCLLSWPALPREGQPPGPPSGAALAQPQCHCLLFQASMSSLPSPYPTTVVNCGRTGTRAFSGREDPKTSNNSIPTTLAKTRLFCLMGEGWGNGAFSRGSRLPWSMSPNPEFQPARQTAHRQGFSMPEERGGWELFPLSQVRKSGTGDRPSSFLSLSLCPSQMLVQPQCRALLHTVSLLRWGRSRLWDRPCVQGAPVKKAGRSPGHTPLPFSAHPPPCP